MPISTADLSTDVTKNLFIDRWGISTLTDFTTKLYARFENKSPQFVYIKAVINDPSRNWTFNDGTTAKTLGAVGGLGITHKYLTLKRAVPSIDVEGEQFTITFEIYKDSAYTQKIDQIAKSITAYIVDFKNNTAWTLVDNSDFDDGTAQGWTLSLFTIASTASLIASGYSAYYYLSGTTATKYPSLKKTITLPPATVAGLIFYWGAHLFSGWPLSRAYLKYVRVYVNGTKIYEDYVNASVNNSNNTPNRCEGWYQVGIDLTQYAGQSVTIKIEFELKLDESRNMWIRSAVDNILVVAK